MQRSHPQRFDNSAPPGALLKRLFGLAPRIKAEAIDRDEAYLVLLRQCSCLYCGLEPAGEAAHVRRQSGVHNKRGGLGKKPADRWALPLCREHHMLQHRIGELQFWYDLGIDPLPLCVRLWSRRGDLVAMRTVVMLALAECHAAISAVEQRR